MKKLGNKKHLTFDNRKFIAHQLKQKKTIREIAKAIHFTERTIYRELQKGGGRKSYCAKTAQKITEVTRITINQNRAKLSKDWG